ncbi:MAG: hypothetical protein WB625_05320 [Candidatus Sulfotelmatobacter sp.]
MRVCSKKRSSRRRSELFGDYTPETMLIRVWMKTAVRKEVTSFGAFLSTLSHEFCPILILSGSVLPTGGTLAVFMSEQPRYTTAHGEHR